MKIHHIGYLVEHIQDALLEFYILGYELVQDICLDNLRKIHICFIKNDSYILELISPTGKDSPFFPLLKRFRNSPYHFCYIVPKLTTAIDNMIERNYFMIQEPSEAPAIPLGMVCFLMHPNAGMIELLEIKK